jgi:hypothetical protein
VSSDAGGVEAAMNALLVAIGNRLPADVALAVQPKPEPLEELVLELTDLQFYEHDGVRRASARARLAYEPATPGQPDVQSGQKWPLVAPIGPIETEELRWYLEKYAPWPSPYFRHRARKVEENLVKWGQLLYQAALPVAYTADVLKAWARIDDHADRRFSVFVDTTLEADAPEDDIKTAKEAAGLLLALPWELLHDGDGYLFQGAKPVRVRRRLANRQTAADRDEQCHHDERVRLAQSRSYQPHRGLRVCPRRSGGSSRSTRCHAKRSIPSSRSAAFPGR